MADVKFMDLSENDNPATTDSILIGNSTDGLKRTSVGAIANLFSLKGLFHFETVWATNAAGPPNQIRVTAPDVPGYTFAFWLEPAMDSGDMYCHVDPATANPSDVWISLQAGDAGSYKIKITAVYVNSKVA